ncbi:MAG: phosphatase PAP2 family protein [Cellvibrio sp.]
MRTNVNNLLISHFLIPILLLIVISIAISSGDVDRIMADYLYAMQGNNWAWKYNWLTEVFFHRGGRALSLSFAALITVILVCSYFHNSLAMYRRPLLYLLLATAGSNLLVSFLKTFLAVSCPWEFSRYGGHLAYSTVIEQLFIRNGEGCFPAGHACAGFAWISFYFFGLHYQSRWRLAGLAIPLCVGIVLGAVQQVRGAHFISHDIWTLAISWFYSLGLFLVFFKSPTQELEPKELVCS